MGSVEYGIRMLRRCGRHMGLVGAVMRARESGSFYHEVTEEIEGLLKAGW